VSGVTPTVANRLNGNLVTGGFVEDDVRFAPDSSGLFYRADQTVDNVTELFWVALGSPPSAPVAINKPLPATGFVQQYAIRSDGAVLYQGLQNPSLTEAFFVTFSGTVPGSPALASGVITPPLGVAAPVLFNP